MSYSVSYYVDSTKKQGMDAIAIECIFIGNKEEEVELKDKSQKNAAEDEFGNVIKKIVNTVVLQFSIEWENQGIEEYEQWMPYAHRYIK